MNLRVIHSAGESNINITTIPTGFIATLSIESGSDEILFNGDASNDPFDMCLSWASENIRGEFRIERGSDPAVANSAAA